MSMVRSAAAVSIRSGALLGRAEARTPATRYLRGMHEFTSARILGLNGEVRRMREADVPSHECSFV